MHYLLFSPFFFNCRLSGKTWKMAAKFLSILKFCPRKKINTLLKGLKVKWYMYYKQYLCVLRSLIVISKKIKFIYCLQEFFCKYITNDDFGKFPSQITHILPGTWESIMLWMEIKDTTSVIYRKTQTSQWYTMLLWKVSWINATLLLWRVS